MPPSRRGGSRGKRGSGNAGPVELTTEQEGLQAVARSLKKEEGGKALRRDLLRGLREAMEPMRDQAKSNLLSIASAGRSRGAPLRQSVAKQLKAQTRLSGRKTGVRMHVPRNKGMPREFGNAPKALNNPKGWRHPVFGDTDTWTDQTAQPTEWFDRATRDKSAREQVRKAVVRAMDDMAARIARKGR